MKSKILISTLLILISVQLFSKSNDTFFIKEGVLDLKYTDIHKLDMIKLQGECEFYWNEFLSPVDFRDTSKARNPIYGKLLKSWTSYSVKDEKLPNKGYGTYRILIDKPEDLERTIYGLKLSTIFSSYKLWVNGELLSEVGFINEDEEKAIGKYKYQDVPIVLDPSIANTSQIEIIFQISNYNHVRAGLARPIFFGDFNVIKKESRNKDILNLLIIGIVLIISINHLIMFLFRRKDVSNFYFGILSLVMILRNIASGDRILTFFFPDISWELLLKIDNFSGFGTIPLFAMFFFVLFRNEFPKIIRNIIVFIGIFITILVFATPGVVYGKYRMFYEIYILIGGLYLTFGVLLRAAFKGKEGALMTFIGMFILYATAINDVMSSMGIIQSAYIAPYGLVIFMLIQSITMTSKSAKAINGNEKLSEELKLEKSSLESKIEERTRELQKQTNELIGHQEKEKENNWINTGLSNINNLLSTNKENLKKLSQTVLSSLVKYLDGQMGIIYLVNETDMNNRYLELIADYACSKELKNENAQIPLNVGMIGACYSDNESMYVDNIPENYAKISSGLGKSYPKSVFIVPLATDEKVLGVMEIASFKTFTKVEMNFIERIAINIANTLNTVQMNVYNVELIEQFKEQSQIMQDREIEMRQGLEELEFYREQYETLKKEKTTQKPAAKAKTRAKKKDTES